MCNSLKFGFRDLGLGVSFTLHTLQTARYGLTFACVPESHLQGRRFTEGGAG